MRAWINTERYLGGFGRTSSQSGRAKTNEKVKKSLMTVRFYRKRSFRPNINFLWVLIIWKTTSSFFHDCQYVQIPNPDDAKLYDTVTFEGPPVMEQTLWPRHCVQNSWGAKMHANLKVINELPRNHLS